MQFLNALIEAEGIDLDGATKTNGRGGRSASYRIHVQSNGNLLVGSAYTKELGLQTGDEFEVILGRITFVLSKWSEKEILQKTQLHHR